MKTVGETANTIAYRQDIVSFLHREWSLLLSQ